MLNVTARTSVDTLDFVKVTESAALAASRWMGRGERNIADGAAVEKMREALNDMEIAGRIVIGEGERDEAPMLFIGEELGRGGYAVDIAVDPVEGTNLVANGLPNSIAVMALSERGGLLHAPDSYMQKLAVGPKAAPYVHIDAPVAENLEAVANALERPINDITVVILERPRHEGLIVAVRAAGARIKLISDGDVDAAIATAIDGTGIHVSMGIGGAPEGVLAAAALKCLGGGFMGRLKPRSDDEARARARWASVIWIGCFRSMIWRSARTSCSSPPVSPTAIWSGACVSPAIRQKRTRFSSTARAEPFGSSRVFIA